MIPLSSPSIAAHTALSGEPETFNNFAEVKHASVFETVKLGISAEKQAIQKMSTAPVLDEHHNVLGVLQISRKGSDLPVPDPILPLRTSSWFKPLPKCFLKRPSCNHLRRNSLP